MKIKPARIWQVAAGDTNRDFVKLCLDWDVILFGPGRYGRWDRKTYTPEKTGCTKAKIELLRVFCEDIKDGNIVVLRLGTKNVCGVGVVVGPAGWAVSFGDIDGWDLQHYRRVRWLWKGEPPPGCQKPFTLKFGGTVQELSSKPIQDWIADLEFSESELKRKLADVPKDDESPEEKIEGVAEHLFNNGIASRSIRDLTNEISELVRIAKWYRYTAMPSESETVAYLVAPLLRALGWTPQKMAVEWHYVDVALFQSLPRKNPNLTAVVEVKKMDRSCLTAKSQAEKYALEHGSPDLCKRVIVTDGLRYAVFLRTESGFGKLPTAYVNLTRLYSAYPIYPCQGAKEALLMMSADWTPDNPEAKEKK